MTLLPDILEAAIACATAGTCIYCDRKGEKNCLGSRSYMAELADILAMQHAVLTAARTGNKEAIAVALAEYDSGMAVG